MKRSCVLNLPPQLVFPEAGLGLLKHKKGFISALGWDGPN
jgi:hypothetical protein